MSVDLPSYSQLSQALEQIGSVTCPAECHGIAVGQLCAAPRFDPTIWLQHIFNGNIAGTSESLRCAGLLAALAKDADRRLKASGIELELFLPDNDGLSERIAALAAWCRGFLLGISLAGIKDLDSCSAETREYITDLGSVARADTEGAVLDGDENEDERAYVEILEYVRIGALLLREDVLFGKRPRAED